MVKSVFKVLFEVNPGTEEHMAQSMGRVVAAEDVAAAMTAECFKEVAARASYRGRATQQ